MSPSSDVSSVGEDKQNSNTSSISSISQIEKPPLWRSCRMAVTIFAFFALFINMLMRLNFSMALVCMTGTTTHDGSGALEGEFDWSQEEMANLLAAFFYGNVTTQLIGGIVAKKFGERFPMMIAMGIYAIVELLLPVLARWHYVALFVARVVQGLFSGTLIPMIYSLIAVWSSPWEKATLLAIAFTGNSLCNLYNYPTSALFCTTDIGWPLVFYVAGAMAVVWIIAFFFLTSNDPESHPRISEEEKLYLREHSVKNLAKKNEGDGLSLKDVPYPKMLLSIPFYALLIAHLCVSWTFYLIGLNIPLFVDQVFNLGIIENGLICAIPYIFIVLTNYTGKFYDLLNSKQFVSTGNLRKIFNFIGSMSTAIMFIILPYPQSSVGKIAVLTAAGCFNQLPLRAGFFLSFSDVGGSFGPMLFAISNTIAQLPGFINPLIIAALAPDGSSEGWQNVFYVAAAISGFGAIVYVLFGTSERQPWAETREKSSKEDKVGENSATTSVSSQ